MNFYVDSGGAILGVDPEKIYQGSANANTIRFVGAFASNVKVTVAFKLPTGVWTTPQLMTASTQLAGVVTSNGVQFNVWEYSIPALVTETFGTVNMQFYVYGDAGNGNGGLIATASSSFQVERGVPITLPDPTDDYETLLTQILSALSLIEGKLNFDDTPTIGSDNPVTSDGIAKALNTKASLQEDNTFEGTNRFSKKAYFNDGAYIYEMDYYFGGNRNNWHLTDAETKVIMNFWAPVESDRFDIELRRQTGTMALLSDLTPIEEEVAKKYDKTGGTIDGNVTVTGDLTVQGTTITENAETLDVKANVITTNSEGVPLINLSGLGIRTDATNVYGIMYDPQSDSVKLGLGSLDEDNNFTFNQGEGLPIAVRDDSTAFTDKHVIVWDAAGDKFVDGGGTLDEKLDKVTGTNTVPRAYTVTETGEQSMTDLNSGIAPYTIVYRNSAGYFDVLDPAQYTNPVSLRYYNQNVPIAVKNSYATQTALANTQRQVDGLYTLLEQKNEIYVQTASDTYTTRETAGGENIADGVQTPVKKITGKTVKTTNLFSGENVTTGNCTYENGVAKQIAADNSSTLVWKAQLYKDTTFVSQVEVQFLNTGRTPALTFEKTSDVNRLAFGLNGASVDTFLSIYISEFPNGEYTITWNVLNTTQGSISWNDIMLNEGSTALPYMPYFSGLKNAFFKEIVSTGRNLIPYPYYDGMSKTENGITFIVNTDGTITVNGTATDRAIYYIAGLYSVSPPKNCIMTGCPSGGGSNTYSLEAYNEDQYYHSDVGSGTLIPANFACRVIIVIRQGTTVNKIVFKPMLNYGSSALPYEPYTQSVLSLPEAVELTEYDTAYPETGEIQRQSETDVFNGTEMWNDYSDDTRFIYTANLSKGAVKTTTDVVCNLYPTAPINGVTLTGDNGKVFTSIQVILSKSIYPNLSASTAWKSQLAAWNEAGNPLTVTYKTAEVQSTEQANFSADSYIAWKNGSETIEQGDTDNSIYGAENTVEQDYYLLTAPQEVTKE